MDINKLRSMRSAASSKITSEFEKVANPESSYGKDDRFWQITRDKAGNGSAVIRFLPPTEGDELPWVKIYNHAFQGPGGRWYIENSLTTIGKNDPVSELNRTLWNSTTDDNSPARKQARAQKRRTQYIANILVVSDPKNPENNGQVKLFKFGKKVFDMIMNKARPSFEDEEPVNVFDYWDGANLKLRVKMVDNFPNYDSSTWDTQSPVGDNDNSILEIANRQFKLSEFTDEKNFKSFEALQEKLNSVLNAEAAPKREAGAFVSSKPAAPAPSRPAPKQTSAKAADDDDELSYFRNLATMSDSEWAV